MSSVSPFKSLRVMAGVGVIALLLVGCGASATTESASEGSTGETATGLSIVVSTSVLGDVVSNVVGDYATVEVLLPIGADPHDYQVSSAQTAAMQSADLVVVNGLLLEEAMLDVIEGLESDGANVLEVAALLDPIPVSAGGHEPEADGGYDPHVWMDPLRMATAAQVIAAELIELDDSVDWMGNSEAYSDELTALDAEIVGILDAVPKGNRKMVTNHDSFGYFADRYDFEIVGTVIPGGATLAEPSSAALAALVEVMTDEGVNVIFAETIEPSAVADAIAAELDSDVAVVELYTGSLGEPGSDADTYIGMLRANAQWIGEALS